MIIGITGGIASGKSTLVSEIRQAGYQVIDADQVVHDLQAKGGKLYQALVDYFGQGILQEDGQLNRPYLSQLIFSSEENKKASANLQNEIIRQALADLRDELSQTEPVFFMDIPLLIELGYEAWFDQIWLVYVDSETQKQRLMARNSYTAEEASQRIASQMSLEDKKSFADVIIDNSGDLEQTKQILSGLLPL